VVHLILGGTFFGTFLAPVPIFHRGCRKESTLAPVFTCHCFGDGSSFLPIAEAFLSTAIAFSAKAVSEGGFILKAF
jgi:hypothetical protein